MQQSTCSARLLMRRAVFALTASAAIGFSGCDPHHKGIMSTPEPHQLRLAIADQSYRLSDADRAELLPGFDVDALERLLALTNPEHRQEILKPFQKRKSGERVGILVKVFDPELQKILEEVWAPQWDHVEATDEELAANAYQYPGREIAMQRRAARARLKQEGSD